jgi:hypothetical protein
LPQLARQFAIFRRPQHPADRLPGRFPDGTGPTEIDTRYSRRAITLRDGSGVFVVPGTLITASLSRACLAHLSPTGRTRAVAHARSFDLPLIFVQVFDQSGIAGTDGFWPQQPRQIGRGDNMTALLLGLRFLLLGIVPDGVASVSVNYARHVTFRAEVHHNLFVHWIPGSVSAGSGAPPREVWRDRHGRILRTMVSKNDGTIIVTVPGHVRTVIPGD